MKQKIFCYLLCSTALTFFLVACQKDLKPSKDNTILSTPLPTTGTYCRIERLDGTDGQDPAPYSLNFSYDLYENPVAVLPTHPIDFVRPTRYFLYDTWHRLKEYRVLAKTIFSASGPIQVYNEWHFYGFDLNGRIGVDTAYFDVVSTEDLNAHTYGGIKHLEYDAQGRIVREIIKDLGTGTVSTRDFAYNAQGNLINNFPTTYDTKMSILRTNDIWMFLSRDYSMNNPFVAGGYNSAGYPMALNNTISWVNFELTQSTVIYGCRQSHYF